MERTGTGEGARDHPRCRQEMKIRGDRDSVVGHHRRIDPNRHPTEKSAAASTQSRVSLVPRRRVYPCCLAANCGQ